MAPQYIYVMKGLGKTYPPDAHGSSTTSGCRSCPGAKIGVLGLNGAGKSTLLKIMAGVETNFVGEALRRRGRVASATCRRSRSSIPTRTCRATSKKASPRSRRVLDRYDAVNGKLGDDMSPEEMEKLLDEQAKLQDKIDATNAWDLDSRLDLAMDALRCPPGDADVSDALRRRAPARRAVPAAAAVARPAAARRADQPPRRRIGGLARAVPEGLPRHGRRRDARSLLPRQRRRLDPRARSRQRHSLRRQLHRLAGAEAEPAGSRRRRPRASGSGRCSASWSGFACRRARGRPRARPASTPTRSCWPRTRRRRSSTVEIYIPPGPRLGDIVVEARGLTQGLRRHRAVRRPDVHPAARRHRRRDRPERRRQDDDCSA